jgi:hypothetical protein
MTGWGKESLAPADFSLFARYLVKPIDFTELLKAIEQVAPR